MTDISWRHLEGLEVVDSIVVNQQAAEGRIGLVTGTIATEFPRLQGSRVIQSGCGEFAGGEGAEPSEVSYIVLELSLTDPTTPGAASELAITSGDVQRVEPVSVVICPVGQVECTAESGPPSVTFP